MNNDFKKLDVSLLTRKHENDDIKLLTINTLNSQIGITKVEIKSMNNKVLQSIIKMIAVIF